MNNHIAILDTKVSVTNLELACSYIEDCINRKNKTYICIAPVSTIVDAQSNSEYRKIVNNSGMTTPDGMPLVWLGRMKGERTISRTYGPDLMRKFCGLSQEKQYKHYFYGGTPETNKQLSLKLKEQFPELNIVGDYAPPMRGVGEKEDDSVIQKINEVNPDVLWIGLGSPKQDYWMYHHRDRLNAPVMIGVGAAFDFLAETKKQAPVWMQRFGLEWFFRLCSEPKRLWKRYLIGNSVFIYLLIKDFLKLSSRNKA